MWGRNLPVDDQAAALVKDIETKGFGVLPNFLDPETLLQMQDFVNAAVEHSGGAYVGFNGPDEVAGSGLDALAHSPPFRQLVERIYERGTGRTAPDQEYYQVLRCLTGRSAAAHSNRFHYDSYVLTILLPIVIPTKGQRGDFIMIPNFRPIRSRYLINAFDKVLLDNRLTQAVLRGLAKRKKLKLARLALTPGSAYFFWGYRSIHTNEACDLGQVRATALFHYANPHAGSSRNDKRRAAVAMAA